ncbi:MAG: RluA family pseudouridine synthase [Planctomycetota bacterium]
MPDPTQQPAAGSPGDPASHPRLDVFLGRRLGLSRQRVRDLLAAGHVRVDGQTATLKQKGKPIGPGQDVTVDKLAGDGQAEPKPDPALELEALAEGPGWVVVNKPASVPVRPHRADETGTVINALAARYPQLIGVGEGGLRSGVVHRLDTDTSGCLIVATEQDAWNQLRACFAEHRTAKRYTALVHGRLPQGSEQRETLYLRVARRKDAWVRVADVPFDDARRCTLTWKALRGNDTATLIEVDLETGFLHQIRAMMAHLGHPVVGDDKYAPGRESHGATRQMLHASALVIEEVGVSVDCGLPSEMHCVIDALGV